MQQTLNEGWPRRGFSQTVVYVFPSETQITDVERYFVEAGVHKAFGSLCRDVNPNRKAGDRMRNPTVDDGHVTFSIYRRTGPTEGTPFGDVLWAARQLRDRPPTATDLAAPLYPGAEFDIDTTAPSIISEPSPVVSYFTSDSPEAVKAFYGIPAGEHSRKISHGNRLHSVSVQAFSSRIPGERTRISIALP